MYWYIILPRWESYAKVSFDDIYKYKMRWSEVVVNDPWGMQSVLKVEIEVFTKPAQHTQCTDTWVSGKVKKVISETFIEINGILRYIQDVIKGRRRKLAELGNDSSGPGRQYQ